MISYLTEINLRTKTVETLFRKERRTFMFRAPDFPLEEALRVAAEDFGNQLRDFLSELLEHAEKTMPGNGTWTVKHCDCDVCGGVARFDAKSRDGPWGNFCLICWLGGCPRLLGTDIGQMLVSDAEDPRKIAVQLGVDDLVVVSGSKKNDDSSARQRHPRSSDTGV